MKRLGPLALCALLACTSSKSSESQSSYAQKVDTVTERGAVKVVTTVREFAPDAGYTKVIREIVRVTERDPVVTHTDSAVQASGSAEAESKSRPFGIFALLAAGWPFLLWACGAAALVILRPPWLIAGWSLVKSLFGKGK